MTSITIPARSGSYFGLKKGERLKLINPHGNQVIDFWAFVFPNAPPSTIPRSFTRSAKGAVHAIGAAPFPFTAGVQYFSASRTRSILSKLIPSAASQDAL